MSEKSSKNGGEEKKKANFAVYKDDEAAHLVKAPTTRMEAWEPDAAGEHYAVVDRKPLGEKEKNTPAGARSRRRGKNVSSLDEAVHKTPHPRRRRRKNAADVDSVARTTTESSTSSRPTKLPTRAEPVAYVEIPRTPVKVPIRAPGPEVTSPVAPPTAAGTESWRWDARITGQAALESHRQALRHQAEVARENAIWAWTKGMEDAGREQEEKGISGVEARRGKRQGEEE
ncbi:hypothetical protein EDC01DRAFT_791683 [Geopyxis carbonaria]|nr:hypothetical protein EDC01DRAFT_791683 [Geopyxis carbonaria]